MLCRRSASSAHTVAHRLSNTVGGRDETSLNSLCFFVRRLGDAKCGPGNDLANSVAHDLGDRTGSLIDGSAEHTCSNTYSGLDFATIMDNRMNNAMTTRFAAFSTDSMRKLPRTLTLASRSWLVGSCSMRQCSLCEDGTTASLR